MEDGGRERKRYCGIQPKCRVSVLQSLQRQRLSVDRSQTFCWTNYWGTTLNRHSLPTSWTKLQRLFIVVSYSCCLLARWKSRLDSPYVPLSREFFFFFFFLFFNHTANHADALQMRWWRLEAKDTEIDREKDALAAAVLTEKSAAVGVLPPSEEKKKLFNTVNPQCIPLPRLCVWPRIRLSTAADVK